MIFCVAGKVSFSMWASPFASLSRAQKIKRFTEADQLPATVNKIEKRKKETTCGQACRACPRARRTIHGQSLPDPPPCRRIRPHWPRIHRPPSDQAEGRVPLDAPSHHWRGHTPMPLCPAPEGPRPHAAPSPLRVATEGERGVRELGSGSM